LPPGAKLRRISEPHFGHSRTDIIS
jgi:hypothetical protein